MDEKDPLQAYTTQIVALGQAALAHYRRGEALPEALSSLAASLLALEEALRTPASVASARETAPLAGAPEVAAPVALPAVVPVLVDDWLPTGTGLAEAIPADQPGGDALPLPAGLAPPGPTAVFGDDNAPDASHEVDFAAMTPVEADNWLSQFAEGSSGMLVISEDDETGAPGEPPLVIDVEEEAGGGPAVVASPVEALPPLVIDPVSLPADEDDWPGLATAEPAPAPALPEAPEPTTARQYCTNCGAFLRPGRRFCYRCGAPVAEMMAEVDAGGADGGDAGGSAGAPAAPPPASVSGPPSEWPTIVGDMPTFEEMATPPAAGAPAPARFCNNCGLGIKPGVTICPDCGSSDIA